METIETREQFLEEQAETRINPLKFLFTYFSSIFFFILGFMFTYWIFTLVYAEEALTKLYKGISVQNFIDIIVELNFSELLVIFYFIALFIIFFLINLILKQESDASEVSQKNFIASKINNIREGAFTLPFIIMIAFPMVLQVILPSLIISVAIFELTFPFIIMGELYSISKHRALNMKEEKRQRPLQQLIGVIIAFPLGVFLLIITGLDRFLHLVHFHILWDNPDSSVATTIWDGLNRMIDIIPSNNQIFSIIDSSKYFIITFLVLLVISQFYVISKKFLKYHSTRQLEKFILRYD